MQFGFERPMFPIVQLIGPEDLSDGASASVWVSMENVHYGIIVLSLGDLAGAGAAITLDQATDSSGTGTKTLEYDYLYQSGQKLLFTGRSATNFLVGDTVIGGSSNNQGYVVKVGNGALWVVITTAGSGTGTTWTDNEALTASGSGASATMDGTGTDEDILLQMAVTSDTYDIDTLAFKNYVIFIDHTMFDADNDFNHFQLDIADASSVETIGSAIFIPLSMRTNVYPQVSLIGTQKLS